MELQPDTLLVSVQRVHRQARVTVNKSSQAFLMWSSGTQSDNNTKTTIPPIPFTNQLEGDAFREWVYTNHSEYIKNYITKFKIHYININFNFIHTYIIIHYIHYITYITYNYTLHT